MSFQLLHLIQLISGTELSELETGRFIFELIFNRFIRNIEDRQTRYMGYVQSDGSPLVNSID